MSARIPHNIDPWPLSEIKTSFEGHPTYGDTSRNPWPEGYCSLAQVLGPIEEIAFESNPVLNENPTVSHPVTVFGKSTNQVISAQYNAGGKPAA